MQAPSMTTVYLLHQASHELGLRCLDFAGIPEVKEALAEAAECVKQARSESVRQHPKLVEHLMSRAPL